MMTSEDLEKYSSAFTMSDMEIFIFPDLLYAQVLANILSPEIWKWRKDKWFSQVEKLSPVKRIHRVKQYIMDHYEFNLDLETWGLTDKLTELSRFGEFIDPQILSKSNALFGYEGDKYYFDLDIRRHFGLDKYDTDIIPYWKTESIEAMNAFRYKPGHTTGAGECVSLACLYAAALFIIARIPLEKIFLMGTPLHSQNFVLLDSGVLTNNRRILTKQMWFNGTELTSLARRALEHEQITVVAHCSGWIHVSYPEATIKKEAYIKFRDKLMHFLESPVTYEIFINFLRSYSRYQKLFQLTLKQSGSQKYIRLEKAFSYEHDSKNRLGDKTAKSLYLEIDGEDFSMIPHDFRAIIDPEDELFSIQDFHSFRREFLQGHPKFANQTGFFQDFKKFIHTVPQLPSQNKEFPMSPGDQSEPSSCYSGGITSESSREEITRFLLSLRKHSTVADLAFYAGRYMDTCDWQPFLKAAFERNPVSVEYFSEKEYAAIYQELLSWPDESIYEGNRLALPDEVVNFKRGDGLEKGLTFINILRSRKDTGPVNLIKSASNLKVKIGQKTFTFSSNKSLIIPDSALEMINKGH